MLSKIIEKEYLLDIMLPVGRLEDSPSAALTAAGRDWSEACWEEAALLGPIPLTPAVITKGLRLAQNPVFICGVHRSGTTLLRNLADGHPNLVVLPSEGTYYTNIEAKLRLRPENERAFFLCTEWLRRMANPINQPPYWVLGRSSNAGSPYVDFARYVMAWWQVVRRHDHTQWPHMAIVLAYASCTGGLSAKFWVDKTPTNERFLARIREEMPAAKIIHVVRDPLDTLTSRKKMEPTLNLRRALIELKTSFRIASEQAEMNDPNYLLIKYENLCEQPDEVIDTLGTFLNIKTTIDLNRPTVGGALVKANSAFARQTASGLVLKPNQHPQQKILSKAELQLVAAYIGNQASKLNYLLPGTGPLRKSLLKLRYRLF